MQEEPAWSLEHFPIVSERDEPKAVLVDIEPFKRLEFILDNLLNREPEPEDVILSTSDELRRLVESVRATTRVSTDWEMELCEL